ncbi:hypothetical protein [Sphingomonas sp. PP-F2F-A104-K0414]|uniref:hypothetical protein n=1 Tax=Sphingomonas sp. PP-F2F-A104-K0414 TaxID=2135661 RepID=UPI00104725B9|nr:hypothetical protein [Sphingomonas sp. PP-F2F-A104-K0414]
MSDNPFAPRYGVRLIARAATALQIFAIAVSSSARQVGHAFQASSPKLPGSLWRPFFLRDRRYRGLSFPVNLTNFIDCGFRTAPHRTAPHRTAT